MDEHLLPENQVIIKEYREDLNLDVKKYSDAEVWEIVKSTKYLAKLYVDEYKHFSPEDMLKQMGMKYNLSADNHGKDTLDS